MHKGWATFQLGDICTLKYGKNLPQISRAINGTYPVYGSNGTVGYHSEPLIKAKGIIIGRKGTIGAVHLSHTPFWPIDTTFYVEESKQYDLRFIYYLLKTLPLSSLNTDSAVPGINRNLIHEIFVKIPNLQGQEAIAEILGSLDDKIELNRKMNATLEDVAQALFKSWFIDFDPVHAKSKGQKPHGMSEEIAALFPVSFQKSELGMIPKGWKWKELLEIIEILESGSRPKGGVSKYKNGVPSIGAENILGIGKYDFSKTKYIPMEFYKKIKHGKIQNGDVLLYKDGAQLGRKSYFDYNFPFEKCCVNEHVFILRTGNYTKQKHLYFWLDQAWMTENIRNLNSNSAQPGINTGSVLSLPFLDSGNDLINAFESQISALIHKLFSNCNEIHVLSKLRDNLLPKLLSGEITIKEAANQIEQST